MMRRFFSFTRERSKVRSLVRPPFPFIISNILDQFPSVCPYDLGHNGGTSARSPKSLTADAIPAPLKKLG